jgi:hypothetical protein
MKIFIIGHGRHGKDTVAEFIERHYGLTFESSSMFCAERVCRPWMERVHAITYDSLEECYADRHNHREAWYNAIMAYNKGDPARLSQEIFTEYDMYVGIRSREEFLAARDLSDLAIWVDASDRLHSFDPTCKILKSDCDIILDNNGTLEEQGYKITRLFNLYLGDG